MSNRSDDKPTVLPRSMMSKRFHYHYGHSVDAVQIDSGSDIGLWQGVIGWNADGGNTHLNPDYRIEYMDVSVTPELAMIQAERAIERKRHEATDPNSAGTERNRRIEQHRQDESLKR